MSDHIIQCLNCKDWYDSLQFVECPICEKEADEYYAAIQHFIDKEQKELEERENKIAQEVAAAIEEFSIEDVNSITNLLLYCRSSHITARKCAQIIVAAHERDGVI